jgi:ribosomal protein L2
MLSTAFVGRVSNIYYRFTRFSSFSHRFSIKKKYQTTRGVAKNPVDHPNGGRSKIKQPFLNPWGRVAKNNK